MKTVFFFFLRRCYNLWCTFEVCSVTWRTSLLWQINYSETYEYLRYSIFFFYSSCQQNHKMVFKLLQRRMSCVLHVHNIQFAINNGKFLWHLLHDSKPHRLTSFELVHYVWIANCATILFVLYWIAILMCLMCITKFFKLTVLTLWFRLQ